MIRGVIALAEGFEEIEALTVVDILRRAGIGVTMALVGEEGRREVGRVERETELLVRGSHDIPVLADCRLSQVVFEDMDFLVLPGGGPGTRNLEDSLLLREEIKKFHNRKKWIAAICAAPGILGRMGLLEGRRAVSYPTVEADLKGAEVSAEEVVRDGHIITSRGMGTSIPFALRILAELEGQEIADNMAGQIVYRQG